jgi:hypothetical protein
MASDTIPSYTELFSKNFNPKKAIQRSINKNKMNRNDPVMI